MDGAQKYNNFKDILSRYNKARNLGFELEVSWILYAMAEDRTEALVYHLGFTQEENRQKASSSRVVKKFLQKIKETENLKL